MHPVAVKMTFKYQ